MTVKKMSTDIDKKSETYSVSVFSLVVRTVIYSGFMAGILASFYNFQLNTIKISSSGKSWSAEADMVSINQAQEDYYAKNNKFSDSLEGLGLQGALGRDNYRTQIQSLLMKPVQTLENKREPAQFETAIAIAIPMNFSMEAEKEYGAVYIGAVFAFKKDVSNQLTTISAICQSEPEKKGYRSNPMQPTFDGTEIHCPPDTTILR
ncbi:type IV pilin-like G/H family protein [Microcoleus sp. herbarium12]|uniref:type IV pilin-like G/H family protein n=1 Tax=Microcoleus sp. herbarium12 TaxID=3055437 RepID=UPI002FD1195B